MNKQILDITKEWTDTIDVCEMYLAEMDPDVSPGELDKAVWDIKYYRSGFDKFLMLVEENRLDDAIAFSELLLQKID